MSVGRAAADRAAPNPDDHALVFGIRRYFGAAAGWPPDLRGPDNDAAAVAAWLRRQDGGGLPHDNVRVVCSADAPDPFRDGRGEPDQQRIVTVLKEIAQLPTTYKDEENRQFAGRRLYVYISGHGWATRSVQAALVTAEAVKDNPLNVDVTSWTDWLTEAAAFKQIVLWADTCATRTPPTVLQATPGANGLPATAHPNAPHVRVFESFAAGIGLRAVENQMADGDWHGAFTYALLRGLEGEAQTPVTSDTLSDYLRNAMKQFQSEEDKPRRTVAHEPAFGRRDPITFAEPARQTVPVGITFAPACRGQRVTVARGRGMPAVAATLLTGTEWQLKLEPGLYVVLVDALGLSKAFEAVGVADVSVP
jgi:Caspase domain